MPPWLNWVFSACTLAGLVLACVKYIDGREVLDRLAAFPALDGSGVLLLSALYLYIGALWFGMALQPLAPEVPFGTVVRAYLAGQPATLLPGGIAVRIGLMAEAGARARNSSAAVVLNTTLDMLSFLLLALLSTLWFEAARKPALMLLGSALLCTILLLIAPLRHWAYHLAHGLLERFNKAESWEGFIRAFHKMATWPILGGGLAMTLFTKLLLLGILALCLHGLDLYASLPVLIVATVIPTMIGRVLPTPGGIGPTEIGMVAVLQQSAGIELNAATAAVSIYRLSTILFQALLGALIYFAWWRGTDEATHTHIASGQPGGRDADGHARS
jgi:uncharacterized membrane protein YbhN (UPF0104 family)